MEPSSKLEMSGVTKSFPGVLALDDVSISVGRGEVLGLVGVNGAGKSTLMNILGGIYRPDSGKIRIDGNLVSFSNPVDSGVAGIAFIHQEPLYFPTLTVAENIFATRLPSSTRIPFAVDRSKTNSMARKCLAMVGSEIQSTSRMEALSVGEIQVVEIARALSKGSDIVIFDEPTSSLSIKEKESLLAMIRKLRSEGKSIIYVSHFLDEIVEICDSYAVLRNGKLAGSGRVGHVTKTEIIEMIVGGTIDELGGRSRREQKPPIVRVENVSVGTLLTGIGFTMHQGEILGLWGLMGSGRTELVRALLGLDPVASGEIYLYEDGEVRRINPGYLLGRAGYVTENRRSDGLFLNRSVGRNITSTTLREFARGPLMMLDGDAEAETSRKFVKRLVIKTPSHKTRTANLSGGNQQKVVFAKWLNKNPGILILDEPTRGVDVGSRKEIERLITKLAENGTAVLLISSEVEEMVALSDRVLVLRGGTISKEVTGAGITEAALLASALGSEADVDDD